MAWLLVAFAGICGLFVHRYLTHRHEALIRWPFLGMFPALLFNAHRLFDKLTSVLRDSNGTFVFYGPLLSGKDCVVTCDPRNMEYILKTNFDNFPRGPEFREIFKPAFGEGIIASDGDFWRSQRRLANSHIHSKGFRNFNAKVTQELAQNRLLPLLTKAAREGLVINLQDVLLSFTFESTCMAVFGESAGSLSNGFFDSSYLLTLQHANAALVNRYVFPSSWWKILRFIGVGGEGEMTKARKTMEKFVHQQLASRREGSENLLSRYSAHLEDLKQFTSENFLLDTMISFFLAGYDTSGAALTWFFWLVAQHPQVEAKIMEEMKNALEKRKKDGITSSTILGGKELQELNYLHAALCESLRLYPSIPIGHRAVSSADVLPDGTGVRPGMRIIFSIYSMARMEWIWGKDCLDFKPERWFSEDGNLKPDTTFNFMAFNGGPMTCLGKGMAFVQMKTVAAGILANFRLQVTQEQHVRYKVGMIMTMKNGLMMRVNERPLE